MLIDNNETSRTRDHLNRTCKPKQGGVHFLTKHKQTDRRFTSQSHKLKMTAPNQKAPYLFQSNRNKSSLFQSNPALTRNRTTRIQLKAVSNEAAGTRPLPYYVLQSNTVQLQNTYVIYFLSDPLRLAHKAGERTRGYTVKQLSIGCARLSFELRLFKLVLDYKPQVCARLSPEMTGLLGCEQVRPAGPAINSAAFSETCFLFLASIMRVHRLAASTACRIPFKLRAIRFCCGFF